MEARTGQIARRPLLGADPGRIARRGAALASIAALLLGASLADAGDILDTQTKLYSQGDEELIIRDFFEDRRGGFFLDVGSFHWKQHSTTAYLEDHLGWSGIAIDANDRFRAGFEENRPATTFLSYIVTDSSGGEMTFYLAGAVSSVSEDHVDGFEKTKGKGREVTLPTITLNDLLAEQGVDHIDFLSMDIEGSEPAALRGFDIKRFRPELVCIEAITSTRGPIAAYMQENGYERIEKYLERDAVNWYYRPIEERSLWSELRAYFWD